MNYPAHIRRFMPVLFHHRYFRVRKGGWARNYRFADVRKEYQPQEIVMANGAARFLNKPLNETR